MKSAAESKVFSRNYSLNVHGRLLDLSTPKVMGILNLTPDSFFTGSRVESPEAAMRLAAKMIGDGASILDVGAYSTRPGAGDIPMETERSRVVATIRALRREFSGAIISCDTFRSAVAEAAIDEGAGIINDVSAGELDDAMIDLVSRRRTAYIAMHMRGTPQTMSELTGYEDPVLEVMSWLSEKVNRLKTAGIADIVVDPGFGFAKNRIQNFQILKRLELFHALETPLLVGVSRKSMVWKTLEIQPEDALNGTTVLNTLALSKGAQILRVHDVREAVEAIRLWNEFESV